MGSRNSVQPHEAECDGSTLDPRLLEATCMVCNRRKPQIAIQNDSGKVLYAAVMDDINHQIVTEFKASASIGADGVSGDAGVVWDFARVTIQRKTLLQGSRNVFNISGESSSVWISDRVDFPVSSTPYSPIRVPKGHVQAIKDDAFSAVATEHNKKLQDFLSKPLAACCLLDVPGIGPVNARKLEEAGCKNIARLVEIFITTCNSSTDQLVQWLVCTCEIQGRYANKAAHALEVGARAQPPSLPMPP
jgi:hypothetical protein